MDEDEFDEFYRASFARVVGQVCAMTGSLTEAQDCVQEAFVRAWLHRSALTANAPTGPEAWVRTVAWRLAVSRWRRALRALSLHDRSTTSGRVREPGIDRPALVSALAQLPPDQRQALVLYHLCDLSVADVAAETAVPIGTVKARLSRGRATLGELLKDESQEVGHHD
ncbi:MAG: SigE family RNA polymerase sigma factor [Nocardioidaceae bacterium]